MMKNINYQEWLLKTLKDPAEASAYLNAALEESLKGNEESQHLFLIALRNVAEAQLQARPLLEEFKHLKTSKCLITSL